MSTNTAKRLGYGGSGELDGVQVLITSGSFDEAMTVSYLEPWDIPPSEVSRSRVKHADGTVAYSGSIGIDVSKNAIALFTTSRLLKRHFKFTVGIHDGENQFQMVDCKANTISIAGAPGGLINATVGVVAITRREVGAVKNEYLLDYTMTPDDQPAAYWWSGNVDVRDWTFTYNQDVQPVYSNEDRMTPRYLRTGLISYSLQVTTYDELDYNNIQIITNAFTLTGSTTAKGYTFNGPTDLGMYSHSFETAADAVTGSNGVIIS